MQNKFNITRLEAGIKAARLALPEKLGDEAVNFALDNFGRQGFLGNTLEKWAPRKNQKNSKGKAVLIGRARLKGSIRILRQTADTVVVGSNVAYAKAHNEGFRETVTVKAYSRNQYQSKKVESGTLTPTGKMRMKTVQSIKSTGNVKEHSMKMNLPKRQFLGNSPYLTQRLTRVIAAEILKAAKQ